MIWINVRNRTWPPFQFRSIAEDAIELIAAIIEARDHARVSASFCLGPQAGIASSSAGSDQKSKPDRAAAPAALVVVCRLAAGREGRANRKAGWCVAATGGADPRCHSLASGVAILVLLLGLAATVLSLALGRKWSPIVSRFDPPQRR
jgi:hypothetical protein